MWRDLDRPPLNQERLRRELSESRWRDLTVLDEVDSTQLQAQRLGARDLVVLAEMQTAGRGRRDRTWESPRQAGITMSLRFHDVVPSPWLGIMVSIAAIDAVNQLAVHATEQLPRISLKWPNDLMINNKKFGGVISEVVDSDVIVGIGINVSTRESELPERATSLLLEGLVIDREPLIKAILRRVDYPLPVDLMSRYRQRLSTIGERVRVITSQGEHDGIAEGVDSDGRLVLDSGLSFAVGDVVHLR